MHSLLVRLDIPADAMPSMARCYSCVTGLSPAALEALHHPGAGRTLGHTIFASLGQLQSQSSFLCNDDCMQMQVLSGVLLQPFCLGLPQGLVLTETTVSYALPITTSSSSLASFWPALLPLHTLVDLLPLGNVLVCATAGLAQ